MLAFGTRPKFDVRIPAGIRLATKQDEQALYNCLLELYRDNWLGFAMSVSKVWDIVRHCCRGEGGVAAIIEQDGKIVATTGIVFGTFWYSDAPYLSELWLFVSPDYRQFGYAEDLADFCHWYRDQVRDAETGQAPPLITSVTSRKRLQAKMRWWRKWSECVGAIFVIDGA